MVFTASLLGVLHKRDSVENKLVCCVHGQVTERLLPLLCGRQAAPRAGSTHVVVWMLVKIDPNLANMPEDTTTVYNSLLCTRNQRISFVFF